MAGSEKKKECGVYQCVKQVLANRRAPVHVLVGFSILDSFMFYFWTCLAPHYLYDGSLTFCYPFYPPYPFRIMEEILKFIERGI